jgi:hypothetical protein
MNDIDEMGVEELLESLIVNEYEATNLRSGNSQTVTVIDARGLEDFFDFHSMLGLSSNYDAPLTCYIFNSQEENFTIEVYDQDGYVKRENCYFGIFAAWTYLRAAENLEDGTFTIETKVLDAAIPIRLESNLIWVEEPKRWKTGNSTELWLSGSAEEV